MSILRLVRLGDTGSATRRVAARTEFDAAHWALIQKLASPEGKRLVLVGGSAQQPTVEIAHEALVTAWPHFQNLLQAVAEEKRILDMLIPRAQAWAQNDPSARDKRLAAGADLEIFAALADRHAAWLSDDERAFVEASRASEERRQRHERLMTRTLQGIAATLLVAFVVSGWMGWRAMEAESKASAEAKAARANESRALAALSETASNEHRYLDAVKLALAAWPRTANRDRPELRATIKALGKAHSLQRLTVPPLHHEDSVSGAAFAHDSCPAYWPVPNRSSRRVTATWSNRDFDGNAVAWLGRSSLVFAQTRTTYRRTLHSRNDCYRPKTYAGRACGRHPQEARGGKSVEVV